MSEYLTEQEQIQQIKNWFKQNGASILAGIAIAVIISAGWHYWQQYRNRTLTHASSVFDEVLAVRAQGNNNETTVQASKLLSHYPRTPYAQMAAFMLARTSANQKNYAEAEEKLNWVIDHHTDKAIQQITRLRLARIYIEEKKAEQALDLLKKTNDTAFAGLVDEARGDAYFALNNLTAAREAYQSAYKEISNADVTRPILEMKLENLANT